jgi:hypothetical protein
MFPLSVFLLAVIEAKAFALSLMFSLSRITPAGKYSVDLEVRNLL